MGAELGVGANFPWYSVVGANEPLEQGDFIDRFPIIVLGAADGRLLDKTQEGSVVDIAPKAERFNVIVMTQSCDLERFDDEQEIILTPRFDYSKISRKENAFQGRGGWKDLRAGRIVGALLLASCDLDGHVFEHQVVNLQVVFSVPLGVVKDIAESRGERIRLQPPFREHLAQAFARQFMRVGLPVDLPEELPEKYAAG
jgi:hypothetical protein